MTLFFSRKRWLVLLSLVSFILASAPEPTDTVAVTAFQQVAEVKRDLNEIEGQRDSLALSATAAWPAPLRSAGSAGVNTPSRRFVEAAYRRVIARRPNDPQPWRHLGDLYTFWERPKDALHAYDQAILRGDDAAALDRSLAQLYTLLDDSRQSANHWDDYLVHRPNDHDARWARAWTAIRLADWERARAELEYLLVDDPANLVAHAWLGLLLIGPNPSEGEPLLKRASNDAALAAVLAPVFEVDRLSATVEDPAYRSALLGVALLDLNVLHLRHNPRLDCEESGQVSDKELSKVTATLALRSLLTAIYHNPFYADAYAYIGQAFDQLGRSSWARGSLRLALDLAPESPVVQTLMGLYWDRYKAPALARQFYEAAYQQDQVNATLCLEIAATYVAESNYTASEVWLLFAADVAPNDLQVWKTLAHFYVDLGIDIEESGLAAAHRFLELAPNDASAHDLLGWAYYLTDEDTLARASLTEALTLDPTLASAHLHLGRVHARQGHLAEASHEYRRAAAYDVGGGLAALLERVWEDLPPAYRDGP